VLDRDLEIVESLDEQLCLLGDLPDHFGHFLLEIVPKLWILDWAKSNSFRLAGFHDGPLRAWQADILAAAGVDVGELLLIDRPSRLARCVMPSSLYRLHRSANPDLLQVIQSIRSRISWNEDGARRVFLGRKHWKKNKRLPDEDAVANSFRKRGFEVIYPETLSMRQQIALAMQCEWMAGPIGSQLYLSLFQERCDGVCVLAPESFVFPDSAIIAGLHGAAANFFITKADESAVASPKAAEIKLDLGALESALDQWIPGVR
jgi:capsular polysaccharide biosynthesis protein